MEKKENIFESGGRFPRGGGQTEKMGEGGGGKKKSDYLGKVLQRGGGEVASYTGLGLTAREGYHNRVRRLFWKETDSISAIRMNRGGAGGDLLRGKPYSAITRHGYVLPSWYTKGIRGFGEIPGGSTFREWVVL